MSTLPAYLLVCAQLQGSTAEKPVEVPQPSKPEAIATPPQSDLQDDSDILIELQNVHKSFGGKKVLRGTDIIVRRGEAVGIIGSSGSGKSTTLRLMAGLVAPDWVSMICLKLHA